MEKQIRKVAIDENQVNQLNCQLKKPVIRANGPLRRAALGELGNRVTKNCDPNKEFAKDPKNHVTLRNIKPKVDTHWKKPEEQSIVKTVTVRQLIGNNVNQKKTITTNNVEEQKPQIVRQKVLDVPSKPTIVTLKREESQLNRRSLSKIRAAFKKNSTEHLEPKPQVQEEFISKPASHSELILSEIENIDCNDEFNTFSVSEYVNDIYDYLYQLEAKYPITENHLSDQAEITPRMRAILIDWICEVHLQFHLCVDTLHMTIAIIDRYLQIYKSTKRKYLQLVGVTALFLASKYEELYPPDISDFVYITDKSYTSQQIIRMEFDILQKLKFELGRPCAIHFLRRYSKASNAGKHHNMSKYFVELSLVEYSMAYYAPSKIAAASLYLTLKLLADNNKNSDDNIWTPTIRYYTKYSVDDIRSIVKKLAVIVKKASTNTKLKTVYEKYKSPKLNSVSLRLELTSPLLDKMCES